MKKQLFTLLLATLGLFGIVPAQNLVVNGDLESWSGGLPTGWNVTENISQESTVVHGGSFSARHTSASSTMDFQQVISGIQGGQEYTISYWFYDNDNAARTRIWSYWTAGGTTLNDNADVLRPATYSTNSPSWQQFSAVLNAPATADGFRFEVRVYNQDGNSGGSVFYDDFIFSGEVIVEPEPSSYPTNFSASANGLNVNLSWTDATGAQLPAGYLIVAGTSPALPVPIDGNPVPDDLDLSDGSGALNVSYGSQAATFPNLESNTTYYFKIYPYTNTGANIDYKTDGSAPSANTSTGNFVVIESENFDVSWGNWTTISVVGPQEWDRDNTYGINGTACAQMSGFDGGPIPNEDWLISPGMDFDDYDNESLVFFTAMNYVGPDLECLISENYAGSGNPNMATWTNLSFTPSPGSWAWTSSGSIDVSGYEGIVHIAFKYTSGTSAATWEVDNITITGEEDFIINPEPTNYPTNFTATPGSTSITLAWTDAVGVQLPGGYIIFAGTSPTLPVPVDGSPVPNDPDLSDGSGALNVAYGSQTASFSNLDAGETYYFSIYPYTNSGSNIDYKTDGTAPTANATTLVNPEPSNYPTLFVADVSGTAINLSWVDAVGTQLPDGYIVLGSTTASFPTPVDGTPIPNDLNLADGSGAINVAYGIQAASFNQLISGATYYFVIYPYTNSGSAINYKTDGTPPEANATISNLIPVTIEYEDFDQSWGNWTTVNVQGAQVWDRNNTFGINNTPCAKISGYDGGTFYVNDDWLISPPLNFDDYENVKIEFYNAANYPGPNLDLKVSTNYDGGGNPGAATWTILPYTMSPGSFTWTHSGEVDLSGFSGTSVYIAFHFTSTTTQSKTWEIDEILITGEQEYEVQPEPTNYPTNFEAAASGANISLFWTDAVGVQLPDAYIILAGTSASLPVPVDGMPIPNDLDLSDGSGAINVSYGSQQTAFTGLTPSTTYYFAIYPYTNIGIDIDYKNDGTAPTTNAATGFSPTILYQDFSGGWGDWTTISVTGAQNWHIFTSNGYPDPPSARMNGYSGGNVENEDWLISPSINMDNYQNVIMTFHTFKNYSGPNIELRLSSNYSGSGNPNNANWTMLSFTASPGSSTWTASGDVELSGFSGTSVYVAFVYTSTSSAAAEWQVDNILIKQNIVQPEPTNYPANFSADESGTSIVLTWDDALGAQIPEAYIIFGGTSPTLPVPVDGVPVPDDTNLADGSGSVNVPFGQKEFTFTSLPPNTTFYFTIYPYTNSGQNIDYKTDGQSPTASATSANVTMVTLEYENFNESWGNWTTVNVTGAQVWERNNTFGIDNSPCAKISGYDGGTFYANDDWLISPPLNLDGYENEKLTFYNASNYSGPDLVLKVSNNYDGGGNPGAATWTSIPYTLSSGNFTWTSSGELDLSGFTGNAVYVAFHFTSTTSSSKTWEIDEILITGEEEYIVKPEPTNYPEQFLATGLGNKVKLTWNDATGAQPPDGYIIFAGTSSGLPVPTDGIPVQLDSDLSDGQAAVSVANGISEYTFVNGVQNFTTYYFTIYPYTNYGPDINYKNDGTAPAATAQTTAVVPVTIEFEDFNTGWGNWTQVNVEGPQEWTRNNSFGLNNSPCAQISGYSGGSFTANENWLISPAMNFSLYLNPTLHFYNAKNYNGPDLKVMVSNDYDGGNNPGSANWSQLGFMMSSGAFTWTPSGDIDLSGTQGEAVYVAFQFTSTATSSATWELDNIEIKGEIEIGVRENELAGYVTIHPNPANGLINISQVQDLFDVAHIYSMNGTFVKTVSLASPVTQVNTDELLSGLYFIRMANSSNGSSVVKKLIIR
jgi:hypothetical protein